MFFERIERELTAGEPWGEESFNQVEPSWEIRDFWEIESRQTRHCSRRFGRDRYQKLPSMLLKLLLLQRIAL
ncbi:hypothetical protein [Microseira wollei]|uniref:Transposase n=1 Tax=Microseira wollei NIES-4236 TaxID=2530354 RepID=A0AAV3XKR8_9CYAN|nr:hypothetical protein [Microseira wollei]GET41032.1 hypothetical protein MiSe_58440 [Microseira wollei NIES-4236]